LLGTAQLLRFHPLIVLAELLRELSFVFVASPAGLAIVFLLGISHGALLVIMQHVMLTACGAEGIGKQLFHSSIDPLVTSCSSIH
jgi:hypothetical protein